MEYHDLSEVFCKSRATSLPPHRPYDCVIELKPGSTRPRGRLFSLSRPETAAMDKYLSESLAAGIICPSSSPVGAGFGKKDGSIRPCIDYRAINEITVKNRCPLLLMTTAFELLQGATIFTKLDLRNAYHLVRIREGDEWKTAFNTPMGHWEYLVIPFGLTNTPAVFQGLVNDVPRDMINQFVFVYLDDILIFSKDLEKHKHHVSKVRQHLLENQLFVKAEKCEFSCSSTTFLGYIISTGNLSMDPEKVRGVEEWPKPTDHKALQSFMGFANFYHRFIRNYSTLATPLTHLSTTKVRFAWDQEAEKAFGDLKKRFTSASMLVHPDPKAQFIVKVNTSNVGVGAILSQCSAGYSKVHPCAFYSHCLSPSEQNYDIGCSPSSWHWRNGNSGWNGLRSHSKFGPNIKIWSTCKLQRDLTLARIDRRCFSHASTSISLISLELRMSSRTPSLNISRIPPRRLTQTPFFDWRSSSVPLKWTLRGSSGKLRTAMLHLATAKMGSYSYLPAHAHK